MKNKVLEVKDLTVSFKTNEGYVRAVRQVSFDLYENETLAIVGESGSGKSVSTRAIMGILAGNSIIDEGSIEYQGEDLTTISEADYHEIRGKKIGMIFQDPLSSLNPIMKIGAQITEGMIINGKRLKNRIKDLAHDEHAKLNNIRKEIKFLQNQYHDEVDAINVKAKNLLRSKNVDSYELKQKNKEKIAKLKKALDKKLRVLKEQLPEARKAYRESLKAAKKQVREEYNIEKLDTANNIHELREKIEQTEDEKLIAKYKQDIKNEKEALRRVKRVTKKEAYERAISVMKEVGIDNPETRFKQYPFQFSGGMRQRIVIAIALTADPDILICDEPTTALDVTIQAQILDLIKEIKRERNITVIFITHDLGVVANMADRVAVMYAGKIVEYGTVNEIFYNPKHPYTWALLSSMPDLNSADRLIAIPGTPPDMLHPPVGDAFAVRNQYALEIDFKEEPPFFKISDTHYAATWLLHENAPKIQMPPIIQQRINSFKSLQKEATK